MSNSLPQADVVIIGLGAAGGIASYVLTKAGLNVVGIEAGSYATKADFLSEYDELQGWSFRNALGKAKVNDEVPTWRPNAQAPVQAPATGRTQAGIHTSKRLADIREAFGVLVWNPDNECTPPFSLGSTPCRPRGLVDVPHRDTGHP